MRCPSWSVSAPLLVATIFLVVPSLALAATPPATGGLSATNKRFRFHLGTDLFSLIHTNPDGGDADDDSTQLGFGFGRRTRLEYPAVGAGVTSLGFSGVLLNGHINLGAMFAFTVDGADVGGPNPSTFIEGRGVPFFNYMFNPAGRVTPFVGMHVGVGGGAAQSDANGPDEPRRRRTFNVIYPVVGAQGGVHVFIVDAVSVDFMVNFDYLASHSRVREEGTESANDDFSKDADIINVAFVNVGISAWF